MRVLEVLVGRCGVQPVFIGFLYLKIAAERCIITIILYLHEIDS